MVQPISVIVPLAPGETAWTKLVRSLDLPAESEVILACGNQSLDVGSLANEVSFPIKAVNGGSGRAQQMNVGAGAAVHQWFWFLHADSCLADDTLSAVETTVKQNPVALHYFNLRFLSDGPQVMKLNEIMVRFRSDWLKMPFGDQGFLLPRSLFEIIGSYREDLAYGEDHVFAWQVRQAGYPLIAIGADLYTSARKYEKGGWLNVTLKHVWLTIVQAVPQWLVLQRKRIARLIS